MTQQKDQRQVRLPLQVDLSCRDFALQKDGKVENGVIEKNGQKLRVRPRPGTIGITSAFYKYPAGSLAMGLFYQLTEPNSPTVAAAYVDGTDYKVTFTFNDVQYTDNFGALGEHIPTYFTETSDPFVTLFTPSNGVVHAFDSSALTFAPVVVPVGTLFFQLVLFDNYVFGLDFNTGAVYNSPLAAATTPWDASNFINSFPRKQLGMALLRHGDYLVTVGSTDTVFYYDAGNALGSPLSPYLGATQPIGCLFADSLASCSGNHFWVARGKDSGPFVAMLADGAIAIQHVSNQAVDLLLTQLIGNYLGNFPDAFGLIGRCIGVSGKIFYLLDAYGSTTFPFTLVYDTQMKSWGVWTKHVDGGPNVAFPFLFAAQTALLFRLDGTFSGSTPTNRPEPVTILQGTATGELAVVNQGANYDQILGQVYPLDLLVQSEELDFETMFNKQQQRAFLVGDRGTGGQVSLSWTDDDYATFQGLQTLPMNPEAVDFRNLGQARRRAYKFQYSDNAIGYRFEALELTVEEGSN